MSRDKENLSSESGTPRAAVGRLSLYLRQLEHLHRCGQETVSSSQLGHALEITDAQVRKDLAYFGQFGYPGIGYRVQELRDALRSVLGTDRTWRVALIGVGNLGRALLGYGGFQERGFVISALFDRDDAVVGRPIAGMTVHHLDDLPAISRDLELKVAILSVPAGAAESVTEKILEARIGGILNFAPVRLRVPEDVSVVSVDLGLQLEQLAFKVTQRLNALDDGGEA